MILVTGAAGPQNSKIKNEMKVRYDGVTLICKTTFAWEQKSNTFLN